MGKPLKAPPVYFTLAQVRFNTLLKLNDYLAPIQDGLRKIGFPAFTQSTTIALQLNVQGGQASPTPTPVPHHQFLFANIQQTHCFVLNAESLAFQSTDYGTFEEFSALFLQGLALLHEVARLDFTERVGLRYLDHVFPKMGDSLEQYLAPEVLGLGSRLGGDPVHSFTEAFNSVGEIMLRSRVIAQDGGPAFPPDLLPQGMAVQQRFAQQQGKHATLDTDGFIERRQLWSTDEVGLQLERVHDVISAAFRATVTAYALTTWDE